LCAEKYGRRKQLDNEIIVGVFNEFKNISTQLITCENFPLALRCLKRHGLWFPDDENENKILFEMMDSNQDSGKACCGKDGTTLDLIRFLILQALISRSSRRQSTTQQLWSFGLKA
jgi:hypothetical protein